MRKNDLVSFLIILLSFALSAHYYPLMPEQIASHWNASGEVNGFMSRSWGLFFLPAIMAAMASLFFFIPKIDPLKENIPSFRKYFDGFVVLLLFFMLYIHGLTIYWNLGHQFNFSLYMVPAMAVLYYYLGVLVEKSKRNWFIGIRTPWTLSSDLVWDKTHVLGGKLFKIAAFFSLAGMFFGQAAIYFSIVSILSITVFIVCYSFYVFKKISKKAKTC